MRSLVLLFLALGAACSNESQAADIASASASVSAAPTGNEKTNASAGVADPVAAAVTYVASTDELMGHSSIGRREIIRRLVVTNAVAEQVRAIESTAVALADELGVPVERLVWVEAPLTASLVSSSEAAAEVDVWTVSVFGAPDSGPSQQAWRTVHVELLLADDRWLVSAADADAGPTPRANDLALPSAWDDFAVVARWPSVAAGEDL